MNYDKLYFDYDWYFVLQVWVAFVIYAVPSSSFFYTKFVETKVNVI